MPIRLPTERTYYPPAPNEPNRLLCWIPRNELEQMFQQNRANRAAVESSPFGLEVEVSEIALREFGIELAVAPNDLIRTYSELRVQRRLPPSGYVQGAFLEQEALQLQGRIAALDAIQTPNALPLATAPEPGMSPGEEPAVAFRRLNVEHRG